MHDFIPSIMLVWLIHVEVSLVTVIVCTKVKWVYVYDKIARSFHLVYYYITLNQYIPKYPELMQILIVCESIHNKYVGFIGRV